MMREVAAVENMLLVCRIVSIIICILRNTNILCYLERRLPIGSTVAVQRVKQDLQQNFPLLVIAKAIERLVNDGSLEYTSQRKKVCAKRKT